MAEYNGINAFQLPNGDIVHIGGMSYGEATQSHNGLLSAADKKKIDTMASFTTFTLPASGWANNSQTKSGLSAVTAGNCVIVSPVPASMDVWVDSLMRCASQGNGSLTFTCDTAPTADISVVAVILNNKV